MRASARGVREPHASLHPGPDRLGADADRNDRAPGHHRGPAAVADGPAGRLPVRAALPACRGALHRCLSALVRGRARAHGRLLEARAAMSTAPLLQVEGLRKHFAVAKGIVFTKTLGHVKAVDDVSFTIAAGETLGLVGESGCGKTTTSRLILKLEEPTDGQVLLQGQPIHDLKGDALRRFRTLVQAVFQDPWSSLDPRMTVGRAIAESLIITGWGSREEIQARVRELLVQVGLRAEQATQYPHEFSGGQRQRIALASALAAPPKVSLPDEPVSALDVSIRAQMMNLLKDIQ